MDTYDDFKWPVPHAFKDALAKCLFEKGDILYDNKIAYAINWGVARNEIGYSIKVIKPEKSLSVTVDKKGDTVFANNWKSVSEVTLTDYKGKKETTLETYQGNLYYTIWKGSVNFLEDEALPKIPHGFSFVNQRLEELKISLPEGLYFIYGTDLTSNLHAQKTKNLKVSFGNMGVILSPSYEELCSLSGTELLPTTQLICIKIQTSLEQAESIIKEALYSQYNKNDSDKDRFRLRSHGLFINL